MSVAAPAGPVSGYPPASLDRRFYAGVIDRAIGWSALALAGLLGYRQFFSDGAVGAGIGVILGAAVLVGLAFAVMLGLWGTSPGKAALGLRVVRAEDGTPLGIGLALQRTLVLAAAALPTFGLGVVTLAQTAVLDRGHQRRGWHDHLCHSVVVDVRPVEERPVVVQESAPRQVVNLTAMRLAPTAPPTPAATPPRRQVAPTMTPSGATPIPTGAPPGRTALPPGPPPEMPPERTAVRGGSHRATTPSATWRVTFDSGESFLVEGLALVGRRPVGRAGEPVRHLVPLASEDLSVSKTHAQFQVSDDGDLVVMDLGSTNGTILVRSGVASGLPAGRPTALFSGDLVRFGDRSMTVVRESSPASG